MEKKKRPTKEERTEGQHRERSVCVRNLPFSYGSEELETLFSDVGPMKRAFIVKDRETKKSKGYGYVTFAISEDASAAVRQMHERKVEGRSIRVELPGERTGRRENQVLASSNTPSATSASSPGRKISIKDKIKKSARTVIVWAVRRKEGSTPASVESTVRSRLEKCGSIEDITYYGESASFPFEYKISAKSNVSVVSISEAIMSSAAEAKVAIVKNDRQTVAGVFLMARRLCSIAMSRKAKQSCELIVRNLPFKCTRDTLVDAFGKFGPLAQIRLPKKDKSGKRANAGFAFIRFHFRSDAAKAIRKINAKPLEAVTKRGKKSKERSDDERAVAVDWALSKQSFVAAQHEVENDDDEDSDSDGSNVEDEASAEKDDRDEGSDASIDDESEDAESSEEDAPVEPPLDDLDAGTTLFLCNISLNVTRGDIFRTFGKFGHIESLKMVLDRSSGAFRGSAFVRYAKKESATRALERSSGAVAGGKTEVASTSGVPNKNIIMIHDRPVVVRVAVNRKEAKTRSEETKKLAKKSDRRNLHLLQEGHIKQDSEAAAGLKNSELRKRERGDKDKHDRLRSPLFFVSPTRLAIRNLSTSGALKLDTQLRRAVLGAAKEGVSKGVVDVAQIAPHLRPQRRDISEQKSANTELMTPEAVRIVGLSILRNKERRDAKGRPRSRGCAFVEFTEHAHALAALRVMNNNPKYASLSNTGNERLIVGFAVENRAKLKKQREATERRRAANERNAERRRIAELRAKMQATEAAGEDAKESVSAPKKAQRRTESTRGRRKRKHLTTKVASRSKLVTAAAKEILSNVSKSIEDAEQTNITKKKRKEKKRKKKEEGRAQATGPEIFGDTADTEGGAKKRKRNRKRTKMKMDKGDVAFDGLVSDYKKRLFNKVDDRWFV